MLVFKSSKKELLILNNSEKKRSGQFQNPLSLSNFDTSPVLVAVQRKSSNLRFASEANSVANKSSELFIDSSDVEINVMGEDSLYVFDTFLILDKEKAISGNAQKINIYLADSDGQISLKKTEDASISKSSMSKENPREFIEKTTLSNSVFSPRSKQRKKKSSVKEISRKIKNLSKTRRKNIEKNKEIKRRNFLVSFDILSSIESGISSKSHKNLTEFEKFGQENIYFVTKKDIELLRGKESNNEGIKQAVSYDLDFKKKLKGSDFLFSSLDQEDTNFSSNFKSLLNNNFLFFDDVFMKNHQPISGYQNLKGRFYQGQIKQRDMFDSIKNHTQQKLINDLNNVSNSSGVFDISKIKLSKKSEIFSQRITIGHDKILKISDNSNKFGLVFEVVDKNNSIIQRFFQQIDISQLNYTKEFPTFNFEVGATRLLTKSANAITISNNEDGFRDFNVYKRHFKSIEEKSSSNYSFVEDVSVPPHSKIMIYDNDMMTSFNSSYRVFPVYEGEEISNFKVANIKSSRKLLSSRDNNESIDKKVMLSCFANNLIENDDETLLDNTLLNDQDGFRFTVSNDFFDVRFVNVLKRDLTLNEKSFKRIKSLNVEDSPILNNDNPETLKLKDNCNLDIANIYKGQEFLIAGTGYALTEYKPISDLGIQDSIDFFDDDLIDGHVYEYRVSSVLKNGKIVNSSTGIIEEFKRKQNMVRIDGSLTAIRSQDLGVFNLSQNRRNSKVGVSKDYVFSGKLVEKQKTQIDELFKSMSRNEYETYSKEIDEIREGLNNKYFVKAEIVDASSSKILDIGEYFIDPNNENNFEIPFSISEDPGNFSSSYFLKLTPYLTNDVSTISNILFNVENLALKDRVDNIPSALGLLREKISLSKSRDNVKSFRSKKYSTFDSYKNSRIKSEDYNSSNGEEEKFNTGDVRYFSLLNYNNKYNSVNTSDKSIVLRDMKIINNGNQSLNQRRNREKSIKFLAKIEMENSMETQDADFFIVNSVSNNQINSHGLVMFPEESSETLPLNIYAELKDTVGIYIFYLTAVSNNGTLSAPTEIFRVKIDDLFKGALK